jgi:chorismate synthase
VIRVAAGSIARKYLAEVFGVRIRGYLAQLGSIRLAAEDLGAVDDNPFFCAEPARVPELEACIDALRREGDSVGARINLIATGLPPGWGEPIFDRLDAEIAYAMMGINAVKGVEIGAGFAAVEQRGSEHRDELTPTGFLSNHAGGTLGGISSGQDLLVSVALKPTSSIVKPGRTIDRAGHPVEISTTGRHDPCVGIRAVPIAEAMLALVLIDHALRQRAQNADVRSNTPVITR